MRINEDLVLRHIGNRHIIITPEAGSMYILKVYTLNETSAWIWKQLENKDFTMEDVTNLVWQHYNVDWDKAMSDIRTLIDTMKKDGLITED